MNEKKSLPYEISLIYGDIIFNKEDLNLSKK
jgi:hypothetical protein